MRMQFWSWPGTEKNVGLKVVKFLGSHCHAMAFLLGGFLEPPVHIIVIVTQPEMAFRTEMYFQAITLSPSAI